MPEIRIKRLQVRVLPSAPCLVGGVLGGLSGWRLRSRRERTTRRFRVCTGLGRQANSASPARGLAHAAAGALPARSSRGFAWAGHDRPAWTRCSRHLTPAALEADPQTGFNKVKKHQDLPTRLASGRCGTSEPRWTGVDVVVGEVPGHAVGAWYENRKASRPIHPYTVQGIHGDGDNGAGSIVLNGGYAEDKDFGDVLLYTGEGLGRDQTLTDSGNAGLVHSRDHGLPVRVIRGFKGDKDYSPTTGYRYDGLYDVLDYWPGRGIDGFRKWHFLMQRNDPTPPPWPGGAAASKTPPEPVARRLAMVNRAVRSTAVVETVKRLHDHYCQVCDDRIDLPGGLGYSEAAHIRGLGAPHNGPDVIGNILCLCPSDHVRLDRGAIYISSDFVVHNSLTGAKIGPLSRNPQHPLDVAHINYHRHLWIDIGHSGL